MDLGKEKIMNQKLDRYENQSKQNYPVSPFRLFEDFFNDWAFRSLENRREKEWTPKTDIAEKDGGLQLMISLPGMDKSDIDIKIEKQTLTVHGNRKPQESEDCAFHRRESHSGRFSRSFTLPDSLALNDIKADYKYGILTITIPQKPEARPRTIKINV